MTTATLDIDLLSSTTVTAELIFANISSGAKILQQALMLVAKGATNNVCVSKLQLGQKLGMTPGTITKYVNELVKAGLLQNKDEAIIVELPATKNTDTNQPQPQPQPQPVKKVSPTRPKTFQSLEGTTVFEALDNMTKDVVLKSLPEPPAPGKLHAQSLITYYIYLHSIYAKEDIHIIDCAVMWCLNHAYKFGQNKELVSEWFLPALRKITERIDYNPLRYPHDEEYADMLA